MDNVNDTAWRARMAAKKAEEQQKQEEEEVRKAEGLRQAYLDRTGRKEMKP